MPTPRKEPPPPHPASGHLLPHLRAGEKEVDGRVLSQSPSQPQRERIGLPGGYQQHLQYPLPANETQNHSSCLDRRNDPSATHRGGVSDRLLRSAASWTDAQDHAVVSDGSEHGSCRSVRSWSRHRIRTGATERRAGEPVLHLASARCTDGVRCRRCLGHRSSFGNFVPEFHHTGRLTLRSGRRAPDLSTDIPHLISPSCALASA